MLAQTIDFFVEGWRAPDRQWLRGQRPVFLADVFTAKQVRAALRHPDGHLGYTESQLVARHSLVVYPCESYVSIGVDQAAAGIVVDADPLSGDNHDVRS